VTALSLPRRDRAYAIVGGSLFRYRVTATDSALDVAATIRAMPAPESTSSTAVKKLASQVLEQSNSTSPSSRTRNTDSLLAEIRLLAIRHRNLNLLVDGTDDARAVLDHVREVQLLIGQLHASNGAAARLHAFAQLTVAVDSLSTVTSLAIQRVPKFRIRFRGKRVATAAKAAPSAAPAGSPAAPAPASSTAPSTNSAPPPSSASKTMKAPTPALSRSKLQSGTKVSTPAPNHIDSAKAVPPHAMIATVPRMIGRGSKVMSPNDSVSGRNVVDSARIKTGEKPLKNTARTKGDSTRGKPDTSRIQRPQGLGMPLKPGGPRPGGSL